MALRIYFDNVLIDPDSILKLTWNYKMFNDKFKLGGTPCNEFTLWVEKSAVTNHPTEVVMKDWDGVVENAFAVVYPDNIDDQNEYYYSYSLMGKYVQMNRDYSWEHIENPTLQNIVNDIAYQYNIGTMSIPDAYKNKLVDYQEHVTARDMIGYIGEILGGFIYLGPANDLCLETYDASWGPTLSLSADELADLKLGAFHSIDRVVYDNVAHYEYGDSEGEALYLNPDNILFSDSFSSEGIEGMVNYIGQIVQGLTFYNVEVSDASVDGLSYITPGEPILLNGYKTLGEVYNWNYNSMWTGGFNLQLNTEQQEETDVIDTEIDRAITSLKILIDRQEGVIDLHGQQIDGLEEHNIHFQVNAPESEVRVTNQNTLDPDTYTSFRGDGMRVYVEEEMVAEATARRFECHEGLGVQDWVIEHGEDAEVLMIYRRA